MAELTEQPPIVTVTTSRDDDGTVIVFVKGEVDMSNVTELQGAVDRALAESPSALIFEFDQLDFIESSGIAVMVHAANSVPRVQVRHPTAIVRRVIEMTGLSEIFDLT
jgi:anti-sigma B factor antagonist